MLPRIALGTLGGSSSRLRWHVCPTACFAVATLAPAVLTTLRHRLLRPVTWLALLAMFGLALVPALSHAMAGARGASSWAEVCTPQGVRVVALDDDAAAPEGAMPGLVHLEHCPFCGGTPVAAPPSVLPAPAVLTGTAHALPWLFLHAPATLHAWRTAQPRGPPASLR